LVAELKRITIFIDNSVMEIPESIKKIHYLIAIVLFAHECDFSTRSGIITFTVFLIIFLILIYVIEIRPYRK